jgi:murein DD-endopeptidase MepM/ murein hydrolase activator NlpD
MWSFFADLVRDVGATHTVVVMDAEELGKTRRYQIRPSRMILAWGGSLLAAGLIVALLLAFTPLRTQIPGYGTETIEESAQLNAMRLRSLQDSLAAQRHYVKRLRRLITGRVDSVAPSRQASPGRAPVTPEQARRNREPDEEGISPDESAHEQPAIALSAVSAPERASADEQNPPSGFSFPVPPPVASGFPTRDFNAQTGHYGIDVAVSEGEFIRAVGDGYVVWADWTQDGGHTIAVQHADGYLTVYKHNRRLLKHRGDRVKAQEPLAVSGNTGAITTGPHLHFELWRNGLAQDPRSYIAGW